MDLNLKVTMTKKKNQKMMTTMNLNQNPNQNPNLNPNQNLKKRAIVMKNTVLQMIKNGIVVL